MHRRRAFTLIELLVVIAIIGVLVALLLPAVQQARDAARRTQCRNNLKQIGIAMHNYHDAHRVFPPGYIYKLGSGGENAAGAGWAALLLPYLDQAPLYNEFHWNLPLWDAANVAPRERHLPAMLCPSDSVSPNKFVEMGNGPERYAMACYVANFGPPDLDENQEQRDGMFSRNSNTSVRDVTDGLSQTLMVGERENGPFRNGAVHGNHFEYETTWAGAVRDAIDPSDDHGHMVLFQTGREPTPPHTGHTPNSPLSDDRDISAPHVGMANFLFGDGSVHSVGENINFQVYWAMGTRAGGEAISGF